MNTKPHSVPSLLSAFNSVHTMQVLTSEWPSRIAKISLMAFHRNSVQLCFSKTTPAQPYQPHFINTGYSSSEPLLQVSPVAVLKMRAALVQLEPQEMSTYTSYWKLLYKQKLPRIQDCSATEYTSLCRESQSVPLRMESRWNPEWLKKEENTKCFFSI